MFRQLCLFYGCAAVLLLIASLFFDQIRMLHENWINAHTSYGKAQEYLKLCSPEMRATLGDFHHCAISEEIISMWPITKSLYLTMEQNGICSNNRCELFFLNVSDQLPWIVFVLGALLITLGFAVRLMQRVAYLDASQEYYSLPRKMKHI